MKVFVLSDICGRYDLLDAAFDHGRTEGVRALFVLGDLIAEGAPDRRAAFDEALVRLATLDVPIYVIPGAHDAPYELLSAACEAYRGRAPLHLVHRHAALFNENDVVTGFGGLIGDRSAAEQMLQVPDWEMRVSLEHLASFNPIFQVAHRRIALFGVPPVGVTLDRTPQRHVGYTVVNRLIGIYRPHLVCCAAPQGVRGIEIVDGSLTVCPGRLCDGEYAIVDAAQLRAELFLLPAERPGALFRTIVVALDGSPEAWGALELATEMARTYGARLVLTHAFTPISNAFGNESIVRLEESIAVGESLLETAALMVGTVPHECELLQGPPDEAILRVAETHHADLIVMGCRGRGAVASMLGSVSSKVLRHAASSVLVVRHGPVAPPVVLAQRTSEELSM